MSTTHLAKLAAALATGLWLLCAPVGALAQSSLDALFAAVSADNLWLVESMLAKGMDPSSVDANGDSLLAAAARGGSERMVAALLKADAKVNTRNRYGDTPIMLAAIKGHLPIVKQLYEAGAEINHPGWTPLIYAATGGHSAIVEYLIGSGAFLNTASPNGSSALMMAVRGSHLETVKVLLSHGADVNHRNESGESALSWAVARNLTEVEKLLRQAGAKE